MCASIKRGPIPLDVSTSLSKLESSGLSTFPNSLVTIYRAISISPASALFFGAAPGFLPSIKMIPQLKIHVAGTASVFRKAERGVLHIRVWHTSPSQSDVSAAVASKSDTLTTVFRKHALKTEDSQPHPDAAITAFTLSAPSTSSHLPVHPETRHPMPDAARQYTAETTAEVVFRDLDLLASLAVELSAMENVAIEEAEWRLTDDTRDKITREARIYAVRNAVDRANDYADIVGRQVVAFQIHDGHVSTNSTRTKQRARRPGPWATSSLFGAQQMPVDLCSGPAAEAGMIDDGPSLEPATITVSANVNVKFVSIDGHATVEGEEDS